ncbi:MAG: hypothetical protein KDC71_22155 [Acidobacteria bacterium]|nr:hypothetical protein [Acidobacteriota bacterium]
MTHPHIVSKVPFVRSLTFKLLVGLIALDSMLILGIVWVMNRVGTTLVRTESLKLIEQTGNDAVGQLESTLLRYEALAKSLANTTEHLPKDEQLLTELMANMIDFDGAVNVAGGGIWFEPGRFDPQTVRKSFFWGRDENNQLQFFDDYNRPGPPYDETRFQTDNAYRKSFLSAPGYHNEEWYVIAPHLKQAGRGFWSRSYMDPYSYQPMVTVTVAMRDDENSLMGVSTIDLKLEGLQSIANQIADKMDGYAFITDRNNKFLTFPEVKLAKVYYQDEKGGNAEEFIKASEMGAKIPAFAPIAQALSDVNEHLISQALAEEKFDPALTDVIDRSSYQIDHQEAEFINSVMIHASQQKQDSWLVAQREVKNDYFIGESSLVFVFLVPHSFWKLVIVKPKASTTAVARNIKNRLLANIGLVILAIFLAALSYHLLMIVRPIRTLTHHLARIGSELVEGNPIQNIQNKQIRHRFGGEFGALGDVFNLMTEQLESNALALEDYSHNLERKVEERTQELKRAQKELVESAHVAGMAEIATGVLHNIGNLLNTVNTCVAAMGHTLQESSLLKVQRAAKVIEEKGQDLAAYLTEDERGRLMPQFLLEGTRLMQVEHSKLQTELQDLMQAVAQIREVIMTQQDYAAMKIFSEPIQVSHIIEDALKLESANLIRAGVQVQTQFATDGVVMAQKTKLIHVVINLIRNAIESMESIPIQDRVLGIGIHEADSQHLHIWVTDNGPGISAELREKIFQFGFSTKRGARGFGLHFCANALNEMGGRLILMDQATSAKGATFVLELQKAGE